MYIVNNAPALVGFILPPFVFWLNKDVPDEMEKAWLTGIVCFVVAALLHFKELTGGDPELVVKWFAIIFSEAHYTYTFYFKPRFGVSDDKKGE